MGGERYWGGEVGLDCGCGLVDVGLVVFFLRRMRNQARKAARARPTMGPTTAPTIHALLDGGGDGVAEGVGEALELLVTADAGVMVEGSVSCQWLVGTFHVVCTHETWSLRLQAVLGSTTS